MIDVERSQPAPESLATETSCTGEDVRRRLYEDFHGKCYLCEGPVSEGFQVEHLRPRAGFSELEFTWENLFPAHADSCNQRRKRWNTRGWPDGGMLDPAGGDRVEERLIQSFEVGIGDLVVTFVARGDDDPAAENTAVELAQIHGGSGPHARRIRANVQTQYIRVQDLMIEAVSALPDNDDTAAFREACGRLRTLLARSAPYAGLLRTRVIRTSSPALLTALGLQDLLSGS